MARPPVILLPPSEGKAAGGTGSAWAPGTGAFTMLDERRVEVISALTKVAGGSAAKRAELLGVKGAALDAATAADRAVASAPTMPAIERYTGVLYDALDAATLTARDRRRLDAQVAILSGLWGAVQPADPIPDYKLKMGATLAPLGRLSTWWRPAVTAALAPLVAGRVVWDLLPNEHRASWAPPPAGSGRSAPAAVLSARFLDEHTTPGGERRFTTVSHWNKLLKGALVRHVLRTQLVDPSGLVDFAHPEGYRYDPTLTVERDGRTEVTFVRPARS
jgi:cytoplasmic iron level regulating protein YaaA (DUF328/UPF0246 family)